MTCLSSCVESWSCLHSPDTAIHQNSHCAKSQNAAPATKLQKAQAQSVAPATRKRYGNIDRLPKYRACHATRKHHRNACHKTAQNTWYLRGNPTPADHFVAFCERRPTARQ